jgi:hypothetical protein
MSLRAFLSWFKDHKSAAAGLVLVVAGCLALASLSHRVQHLRPKAVTAGAALAPARSLAPSANAAASPDAREEDQDALTPDARRTLFLKMAEELRQRNGQASRPGE